MVFTNTPVPNFVGKTVYHTYKLTGVIGSGAFGAVYRAVDITSADLKEYALKCLPKGAPHSQERRLQKREWAIHYKVDEHPSIVSMHCIIEAGEYVFLVFDICAGGDLFSAITEKRIYFRNDNLIKLAFVQLLDAVQHCHERGVYHRDLKPENVLCSPDGTQLFLTDFGLATEASRSAKHGVGSRYYMSPECIGSEIYFPEYSTRCSDVWSLGVILVNMITSRGLWRTAITDDDCFSNFLHDPNYLFTMLPVSKEANTLLRRVFTMNPFIRITLPEFRKEVLQVTTFFMTDDEIAQSSPFVREVVQGYAAQGPTPDPVAVPHVPSEHPPESTGSNSGSSIMQPVDPDEVYLFHIHDDDETTRRHLALDLTTPRAAQCEEFEDVPLMAPSSAAESYGPVTPGTHSVDDAQVAALTETMSDLDLAIPPPADLKLPELKDVVAEKELLEPPSTLTAVGQNIMQLLTPAA